MENFKSIIDEKGFLVYTIVGVSMMPLLRQRRDTVHLVKPTKPLKKRDVVLFIRSNGQYVLHRLIKIKKDSSLVICGDNQWRREYNIKPSQVIGVMEGYYREEKYHKVTSFSYKFYSTIIVRILRPFRIMREALSRIYHKLFKK